MESEETHDYVRDATRVRSRKKWKRVFLYVTSSAARSPVVIIEGEESYTTNLCQKCFNKYVKAKGENH